MATSTNVEVILNARDNASGVINGVGSNARKAGQDASVGFKEGAIAAGGFLTAITGLGVAMANIAGDFEQNRISFETMLGSAEKGRKALTDLSNFAVKTPFELPQLMQASKSLLAYGIEAENLIPTLKNLGDISSGVGMDKLPNLILAFGQVKAATKLTGMELRQFTEAGVPMLQLLVDQANKAGGSWQMVGGGAKKAKVDVGELNDKLAIARQRLKEATDSGKAKQSTLMSLSNTIQNYEQKLASASDTGTKASRVWVENKVTVEQMKEMISDGAVSFDMVQKALQSATGEGGRFFQMMEKQSKTFGGVMSNIKDQVIRSLAEIAGIDIQAGGLIREGSLFYMMKQAAEAFLNVLNVLTPIVSKFVTELMKNEAVVAGLAGMMGGALVLAAIGLWGVIGAGVIMLGKFLIVGALVGAVVGTIVKAFGGWEEIAKKVSGVVETVKTKFEELKPVLQGYIDELTGQFKAFGERLYDTFDLDASQIGFADFFAQMSEQIRPHLEGVVLQIQQGFKNAFNINFGEGGNIGDLFGRLMALVQPVAEIFMRTMTPAINQFKESLALAKPHLDVLLQQIGPILLNAVQVLAGALAFLAVVFIGILSGIMQAVALAIPFVVQMFSGLAQIINGILTVIVGIFTLNFGMVWEGLKTFAMGVINLFVGFFGTVIGLVVGFVKGVIDFFKQLYDTLVGHSIIPDLINKALSLFTKMKDTIVNTVTALVNKVVEKFEWVKEKVIGVVNAIKGVIDNFKPNFEIGLKLPDIEGAWNSLKNKARSIGIPGFQTGGIVPGPIGSPQLAMVHGGEEVKPVGTSTSGGGTGGGVTINVQVGLYAGAETEKRAIARQLYGALLQVAQSQNKTVQEYMGG